MTSQLLDIGIGSRDVGDFLASVLKNSSKPLTHILQHLSGTTLSIKVLADGKRALNDAERFRMNADGIARCRWRNGLLVTADGVVAASVSLVWLPARLPYEACAALDAGAEPAGVILGRLGMRREDRRSMATRGIEEITGQDAAVRSSALLTVGGQAVAVADECITEQFTKLLV
jgi:hypothetical protein